MAESTAYGYADAIGTPACKSGMNGTNCGVLQNRAVSYVGDNDGVLYVEQRRASYTCAPGDSGGVIYSPTIYGDIILGGASAGGCIYSHITYMHQALAYQGAPFNVQRIND